MSIAKCPACGSKHTRPSMSQSAGESLLKLLGVERLRCKDCDERFTKSVWDIGNIFWAKCPRCYRLDLSTWTTHYYHAPARWRFLMAIGWRRHRCEACRHNFIGLRPAKMKYRRPSSVTQSPAK